MCKPGSGRASNGRGLDQSAQLIEPLRRRLGDPSGCGQRAHAPHAGSPLFKHTLLRRGWSPVRVWLALSGRHLARPRAMFAARTAALDRPTTLGTRAAPSPHLQVVFSATGQGAEARGLRLGHADTRAEALLAVLTRALLVCRLGLPARGTRPGSGPAGDGTREMGSGEALHRPTPLAGERLGPTMSSAPGIPTRGATTPRLASFDLRPPQIRQRAADRTRTPLSAFDAGMGPRGDAGTLPAKLLPKPRWGPVANLTPAFLAPQDLTPALARSASRIAPPRLPTLRVMLMTICRRFRDRDRHPGKQALVPRPTGGHGAPLSLPLGHSIGYHRRQIGGEMTLPLAELLIVLQVLQLKGLTTVLARPRMGRLPARGATEHELAPCPRELPMTLRAAYEHVTLSFLYQYPLVP